MATKITKTAPQAAAKKAPIKNVKAAQAANVKVAAKKTPPKVGRSGSVSGLEKPKVNTSGISGAHAPAKDGGKHAALHVAAKKAAVALETPAEPAEEIVSNMKSVMKAIDEAHKRHAFVGGNSDFLKDVFKAVRTFTGRDFGASTYARLIRSQIGAQFTSRWKSSDFFDFNLQAELALLLGKEPEKEEKPIKPELEAGAARVLSFMQNVGLTDKLVEAYNRAGKFFEQVGQDRTQELWHVVHYFEQWYSVIERTIVVQSALATDEHFNKWHVDVLAKEIEPGEYVRLEFQDGTRGIALGTIMQPAVLREVEHDFLKQMKSFNSSFAGVMKSDPKFQRTLTLFVSIPPFLRSIMSYREKSPALDLDLMHDVFGNPMLQLIPGIVQFNFQERLKMAKKALG